MIVQEDMEYISSKFARDEVFDKKKVVITGGAGFLGYYFVKYFTNLNRVYKRDIDLTILDNFVIRKPVWIQELEYSDKVNFVSFNVAEDSWKQIEGLKRADYIIHMASIASPAYYRKYPMKTIEANVFGLKKMIDFYKDKELKGLLFFSSSEVYGNPNPEEIPTRENFRGNVAFIGPRACYDESKRFGETLCQVASQTYNLPIVIVRPFNNFGPGMHLDDKRVPADFAKSIVNNQDIIIFSDGSPTRTYCYVSDAIVGYLKALTYGSFDYFNIGIDHPEISVKKLADIYLQKGLHFFDYSGKIKFKASDDKDYLTDNPKRRCPDITKARDLLGFRPEITVEDGVGKYLRWLKEEIGPWK